MLTITTIKLKLEVIYTRRSLASKFGFAFFSICAHNEKELAEINVYFAL